MPTVSIIIPTYNRAVMLARAVRSCLQQTYRDREILVVDDGSTDNSHEALAPMLRRYPFLRYLRQAHQGVSAARNTGIRHSRGRYIAFLDSDDRWRRHKLAQQMAALARHPLWPCYTNEKWLKQGVHVNQSKHHRKFSGDIFAASLQLCLVSPSSIVLHRNLLQRFGNFRSDLPVCEDYELFLRLSLFTPFLFIDRPLVVKYGGHDDQLSHAVPIMDRFRIVALEGLLERFAGHMDTQRRQLTIQTIVRKCRIIYTGACKRGNMDMAQAYLLKAVRFHACAQSL